VPVRQAPVLQESSRVSNSAQAASEAFITGTTIKHDPDPCPVADEKLGELYRASKLGLAELIATVSPDVRAALALYCYRRGHLKEIGLAVAATCDERDLVTSGGSAGAALFARSRENSSVMPLASRGTRQKITLASGALRNSIPIEEEPDDEAAHG
jgi:hypothetical protein